MFYDNLLTLKSLKERLLSSTSFAPLHSKDERQPLKKFRHEGISLVPLLAGMLAACGGGGGTTYVPIAVGPTPPTTGSGEAGAFRVSVGSSVIEGAAVYVDVNNDGVIDAGDRLLGTTGSDGVVRDTAGAVVGVDEATDTRLIADLAGAYNLFTGDTYAEGTTYSVLVDGTGRDVVLSPVTTVLDGLLADDNTVAEALNILFPNENVTIEDVNTLSNYVPARDGGTRASDPILDVIAQTAIDLQALLNAVRDATDGLTELQVVSRVVAEIVDADDTDTTNDIFDRTDDLVVDLTDDNTDNAEDLRTGAGGTDAIFQENRARADGQPIAVPDLVNPNGVVGIEDVIRTAIGVNDWGFRDPGDRPSDPGTLASIFILGISVAGGDDNEGTAVSDVDAAMIANARLFYTDASGAPQTLQIASVSDLQIGVAELSSVRILVDQNSDYHGTISIRYRVIDNENQRSDEATLRVVIGSRPENPTDIFLTGDRDNSNDDRYNDDNNVANSRSGAAEEGGRYVVYNGYIRDAGGNVQGILSALDPHYREDQTLGNAQDEVSAFTLGGRDAAVFEIVWDASVNAGAGGVVLRVAEGATIEAAGYVYQLSITVTDSENGVRTESYEIVQSGLFIIPDGDADDAGQDRAYSSHAEGIVDEELATPYTVTEDAFHYNSLLIRQILVEFAVRAGTAGALEANEIFSLVVSATAPPTPEDVVESFVQDDTTGFTLVIYEGAIYQDAVRFLNTADTATIADDTLRTALEAFQAVYGNDSARLFSTNENQRRFDFTTGIRDDLQEADALDLEGSSVSTVAHNVSFTEDTLTFAGSAASTVPDFTPIAIGQLGIEGYDPADTAVNTRPITFTVTTDEEGATLADTALFEITDGGVVTYTGDVEALAEDIGNRDTLTNPEDDPETTDIDESATVESREADSYTVSVEVSFTQTFAHTAVDGGALSFTGQRGAQRDGIAADAEGDIDTAEFHYSGGEITNTNAPAVAANATIANNAGSASFLLTAATSEAAGNDIDYVITQSETEAAVAVSLSGSTISIVLGSGGSRIEDIVTALNEDTDIAALVTASAVSGASSDITLGAIGDAVQAANLTGGTDTTNTISVAAGVLYIDGDRTQGGTSIAYDGIAADAEILYLEAGFIIVSEDTDDDGVLDGTWSAKLVDALPSGDAFYVLGALSDPVEMATAAYDVAARPAPATPPPAPATTELAGITFTYDTADVAHNNTNIAFFYTSSNTGFVRVVAGGATSTPPPIATFRVGDVSATGPTIADVVELFNTHSTTEGLGITASVTSGADANAVFDRGTTNIQYTNFTGARDNDSASIDLYGLTFQIDDGVTNGDTILIAFVSSLTNNVRIDPPREGENELFRIRVSDTSSDGSGAPTLSQVIDAVEDYIAALETPLALRVFTTSGGPGNNLWNRFDGGAAGNNEFFPPFANLTLGAVPLVFTADAAGAVGNDFAITFVNKNTASSGSSTVIIAVDGGTGVITIGVSTDNTLDEVVAAFNTAATGITVTLAEGADGTTLFNEGNAFLTDTVSLADGAGDPTAGAVIIDANEGAETLTDATLNWERVVENEAHEYVITLRNLDDNAPRWLEVGGFSSQADSTTIELNERQSGFADDSTSSDAILASYSVIDNDGDAVVFSLRENFGLFTISTRTATQGDITYYVGEVRLIVGLAADYEGVQFYNLNIEATTTSTLSPVAPTEDTNNDGTIDAADAVRPNATLARSLRVDILDVNDQPTAVNLSDIYLRVPAAVIGDDGVFIGTLTAIDQDLLIIPGRTNVETHSYTLSGDDAALFAVREGALYYTGGNDNLLGAGEEYSISISVSDSGNGGNVGVGIPPRDFTITQSGAFVAVANSGGTTDDVYTDGVGILSETADVDTSTTQMITHNGAQVAAVFIGAVGGNSDASDWAIAGLGDSANYAIVENATGGYDLFYIASEQPGDADARADEDDETFGIAETHTPATDTIRVVGTTTAEAPETQASATATAGALSLTAASVGEVFNGVQIRFVEGAAFTARLAGQDGDAIAATIIVSVPSGTSLGDLITAITADALLSQYVVATATITGGVSADLAASFTLPSVNVALDGGVDGVDAALIFDVPEMPAVPGTDAVSGVAAFFEIAGIRFELDQTGAGGNEFRFAIRNGDTGNSSSQFLGFDNRVGDLDFAIFIPIDGQFDINGNLPDGTGQFDATNPTLQQVVDALESDTTFKTATDAAGNAYNISVSVAAGADGSAVFVNVPAGMRGTANPQTFADGVDEVVGTEGTDVVPASTASQFTGQKDALIDFDPIIAEEDLSPAANAFFEIAGIRFELDQPGAGGNELNIVFTNGTLSSSSQSISFANPRSAADFRVFIPIDGQFDINENLPVGTFDPTNPTIQQVVDALESRTTFKTATDAAGNVYNISVSVAEGADGSATFVNIPAEMRGSANAGSLEGGSTYVGNGEDASVEIFGIRFELEGLGADGNGLDVGVFSGGSASLLSYIPNGVYSFGIYLSPDGGFAILDGSGGFITEPTIAQVVAALNAHTSSTSISDGAGGTYKIVASVVGDGTAIFTSPNQAARVALNMSGDQTFAGGNAATVQTAPTETLENNSGVGTFSYHGGEISVDEFGIDVAGGALYFADRPAASFSGILNLAPTEDGFVYVSLDADGGYSAKFGTRPSDTPSYVLGYVDRDAGTDAIIDPTIAANNVVDLGGIRFAVADTVSAPASIAFATRALTEEEVTADVPVLPEVAIDGTTLTITFVGDTTQTITELAAMINADAGLTGTGLVVTVSAADGTATFDATDIATSTTIEPRSSFFVAITPNNSGTAITTPEDITFVSEEVNYIINFRNENDSAPEFLAVVSGENYGVAENGTTIGATNAIGENTDRGNPNAEGEGGGPVILTVSAFDADDRKTIGEEPATTNERGASLDAAGNLVTSVITYHLDAADDSALSADNIYFTINETTGEVRLSETEIPSYEISGHQRDISGNLILQVEVEVRSTHPSEDTAQTTRQTYEVLIADENDDPTDITISRLALVPGSNEVGSLTATDEDDIAISFNTGEVDEDGNPVPDTNRAPDSHTFALVTDADNNLEDNRSEDNGLFTIAANASGDLALTFNGADTARKGVGEFYRVLIEVTDSAGATFQKAFEFPEGSISVTRDFDSVSVDVYSNGRGTIDENSNGDTTAVTIGTLSRQGTEGVALDNVTFALVNGLVYTGASGAATLASTTFTATTAIDAPETLIINASGALAVIASDAEVPAGAIVFGVLTNTDDIISFEVDAGFPLVAGVYGFANNVLTIQGAGDFTISFVGNVYSLNYGGANVGDLENRDAHTLVISSTVGGETSYETYRVNLRGLDENPIVAKSSDGDVDDNIIENSENGDVSEVTLPLTEALFDISGIDISIRAGDEPTQDERLNTATTNVDDDTANGGFIFNVTDTQNGVIELFDGTSWNVSTEFTLANVRAALVRFNHDSDEQFEKEADAPFETTTARLTQFTVTITDLTANVSTTAEIALDVTPFNDAPVGTNTANSGDSIFVLDGVSLSDIQGEEITFSGYSRDMNGDANPAITATAETATLPASITSGDTFWIWWSNGNDHTAVEVRFVEVSGNVEITTIRATEGTTASPTQAFFDGQAASLRLVDTLGNVGANIRDITIDGVDYANFVRISYSVDEQDSDSTSTGGSDDFTLNDGWLFPAWDIDNGRGDVTVTISETTTVGSIVFKGDVDGTAVEIVLDAGDTFTAQQVADGEIYYRHNGGEGIEQGDRTGEVAPTRDRDGRDTFTYTVDDGANANRGDDYTPPVFTLTFDIIAVNDAPTANPDTDTQHDNSDAYTIGDRIVQDDERVVFNAVGNVIDRGIFLEGGFTDDHYTLSLADVGVYDPDHLVISANGSDSEITYTFLRATGTDTNGNPLALDQGAAGGVVTVEQRGSDGTFSVIATGATFSLTEIANGNIRLVHNGDSQVNDSGALVPASFGLVYTATDAAGAVSEEITLEIQVREINDDANNLRIVAEATSGDDLTTTEAVTRIGTDVAADARIALFFTEDEETKDQDGFNYSLINDDVNNPDNRFFELIDLNADDGAGNGRILKFKSGTDLSDLGLRLKNEGQNYEITVRVTDSLVGSLDGQEAKTTEFTLTIPVRDFDVDWNPSQAEIDGTEQNVVLETAEERDEIDMVVPPRQRFDLAASNSATSIVVGQVHLSGIDGAVYSIESVATSADDYANVSINSMGNGVFQISLNAINRNNEILRDLQTGQELDIEFFLELRADPINTENEPGVVYGFRRTTESFVVRFIGANDNPLSEPDTTFVDQLATDIDGNPIVDLATGEWSFQAADVTPNSDTIAPNGLYFVRGAVSGAPTNGYRLVGLNVDDTSTEFNAADSQDVVGLYGTLTVLANGTWTYTSTSTGNAAAPLGLTTESFTYWVADNGGLISSPTTITITIDGANDAPVFFVTADLATPVTADTNIGISDNVDENAGSLTPNSAGNTSPARLTGTDGESASGNFRVTDADLGAQVRLFIGDVEVGELTNGGTLTFNARYGDLVFSGIVREATPAGSVTFNGTWTYTANERAERIAAGESPLENLEVNIRDEYSARSVTINIDIIIDGVNDAPTNLGQVADSGGIAVEVEDDDGKDTFNGDRTTEVDGRPIEIESTRFQVREVGFRTDGTANDYVVGYDGDGTASADGTSFSTDGILDAANPHDDAQSLDGSGEPAHLAQPAHEYRPDGQTHLERTVDVLGGTSGDLYNREQAIIDGTLSGNSSQDTHLANGIFDAFDLDNFGSDGRRSAIDRHTFQVLGAASLTARDAAVVAAGDESINPGNYAGNLSTSGTTTTFEGIYGTLVVDFYTGEWTYNLNNQDADTVALRNNSNVQDVFTILVTDEEGATYTENFAIRVTGTDDAPILFLNNNHADASAHVPIATTHDWEAAAYTRLSRTNGQTPTYATTDGTANITFAFLEYDAGQSIGSGLSYRYATTDVNFSRNVIDVNTGLRTARSTTNNTELSTNGTLNTKYGAAVINNLGVLTYTISSSFLATYALDAGDIAYETITVHVADGSFNSNILTARFLVRGVNDAPFLNANGATTATVTEAETIANSTGSFTLFDLDGDDNSAGLSITIVPSNTGAAPGVDITAGGSTPVGTAGTTHTDTAQVGSSQLDVGTFTFTRATSDTSFNPESGTINSTAPVTTFDTLDWTYDYNETNINTLGHGETITETIYVRVSDGAGAFILRQAVITVNGVEDAPVIGFDGGTGVQTVYAAGNAPAGRDTNASTSYTLTHDDVDRDDTGYAGTDNVGAPTVRVRFVDETGANSTWLSAGAATRDANSDTSNTTSRDGKYGSIHISADGQSQYVLDTTNADVIALSFGETLHEVIQFQIDDDDGSNVQSNIITRAITIQGTLDDPTVNAGEVATTISVAEGDSIDSAFANVARLFSDVDTSEELAYTLSGILPSGVTFEGGTATAGTAAGIVDEEGVLSVKVNGRLTGRIGYEAVAAAAGDSGSQTFSFTVTAHSNSFTAAQGAATATTQSITFTVTNTNRPVEVIGAIDDYAGIVNAPDTSIDLSQIFTDADVGLGANADTLTYTIAGTGSNVAAAVTVSGNTLTLDHSANYVGNVTVTATDSAGANAAVTFRYTTQTTTNAPDVGAIGEAPDVTINTSETYRINLADFYQGSYALDFALSGATPSYVTINNDTKQIIIDPSAGDVGATTLTLSATPDTNAGVGTPNEVSAINTISSNATIQAQGVQLTAHVAGAAGNAINVRYEFNGTDNEILGPQTAADFTNGVEFVISLLPSSSGNRPTWDTLVGIINGSPIASQFVAAEVASGINGSNTAGGNIGGQGAQATFTLADGGLTPNTTRKSVTIDGITFYQIADQTEEISFSTSNNNTSGAVVAGTGGFNFQLQHSTGDIFPRNTIIRLINQDSDSNRLVFAKLASGSTGSDGWNGISGGDSVTLTTPIEADYTQQQATVGTFGNLNISLPGDSNGVVAGIGGNISYITDSGISGATATISATISGPRYTVMAATNATANDVATAIVAASSSFLRINFLSSDPSGAAAFDVANLGTPTASTRNVTTSATAGFSTAGTTTSGSISTVAYTSAHGNAATTNADGAVVPGTQVYFYAVRATSAAAGADWTLQISTTASGSFTVAGSDVLYLATQFRSQADVGSANITIATSATSAGFEGNLSVSGTGISFSSTGTNRIRITEETTISFDINTYRLATFAPDITSTENTSDPYNLITEDPDQEFTITITADPNAQGPTISGGIAAGDGLTINEGEYASAQDVGAAFTASDPDGNNANITWTLSGDGRIGLSTDTGGTTQLIIVAGAQFDFEEGGVFTLPLTLTAESDGDTTSRNFQLSIDNADDEAPTLENSQDVVSTPTLDLDTIFGDAEGSTLTYTVTSEAALNVSTPDINGVIVFSAGTGFIDNQPYVVRVEATDGNGSVFDEFLFIGDL